MPSEFSVILSFHFLFILLAIVFTVFVSTCQAVGQIVSHGATEFTEFYLHCFSLCPCASVRGKLVAAEGHAVYLVYTGHLSLILVQNMQL